MDRVFQFDSRDIRQRSFLFAGVAIYIGLYQWTYINWLNPIYDYFGFYYQPPQLAYLILAWTLSLVPSLWMPIKLTRPSQLVYWMLYLVVFIPSMFVPMFMALRDPSSILLLMLTLCAGLALTGIGYQIPLLEIRRPALSRTAFLATTVTIVAALTVWVVSVFQGHMKLVSFQDVYTELRFAGDEVMSGSKVGYAMMWLSGAFNPLLMAWGLAHKRIWLFIAGSLGQLLLYSTIGSKSVIISVGIILLLYSLIRRSYSKFGLKLTWCVVALFVALNLVNTLRLPLLTPPPIITSIVFMRIFGMPGYLTGLYHDFFQSHPWTFFSHVKGINLLVRYPYDKTIGIEVGSFYSGNMDLNANAHMWCMDGLAGFGLIGILLVSLLCATIFWLMDSAARGHNLTMATLFISFAALNIGNISLFTSFFSGGLLFIIILFYIMPYAEDFHCEVRNITEPNNG